MTTTASRVGQPGARPRSVNQVARRQRIVDVATAMLEGREFERIQVKDVADSAGVALGTLYHYFSSKEHLFGEVLVQWAGTLRTGITRKSLTGSSPGERLEDALHRIVSAFERHKQMARLAARLEVSEDPLATDVLHLLDTVTHDVSLAVLKDIAPEEAARIVGVIDAVLDRALRSWSAGRLPIADVYKSVSDAVALVVPDTATDNGGCRGPSSTRPAEPS